MSALRKIGNRPVGEGCPVYIIAEIGINHNGDLEIARQLIDAAVRAGCDAVKFQKRTPEICVPPDQRNVLRDTPWGRITYLDYREELQPSFPGRILILQHGEEGEIREEIRYSGHRINVSLPPEVTGFHLPEDVPVEELKW